ncbi:Vps51/Vps67-domain-containing protein [Cokeromyces recurvatus]|uniref:Vps51/Vps67-domain-containing protein n=1 Tax=Cokeromyces recurvatus TaxID=90255 RepID=UPI002220E9A8|nr:Vps51/Vps67-domain-containing protein [Cokeromyces recurvatus]KAI7907948.1 Vps51/Vps67-domain-containing protein [Cokeromyces recurvatus]
MSTKDDPDAYFKELSVPDVRALEQKTRNAIETQKKELRAMVGEQYQDLISAADTIITMSQKAHSIQSNFKHMQAACDINNIKESAKERLQIQDEKNNQGICSLYSI